MINLKFLGKGAAFYPVFGNTNAFFEKDGDLFFLDFGESAFEKAVRLLDLTAYRHVYVLITHLHADHAGSLASLMSYTACVLHIEVTVVHPEDTLVQLLTIEGIDKAFYTYRKALPEDCPVQAKAVEVQHAKDMRCFGYELTDGEETIYFSGDAADVPQSVAEGYLNGRIARIYHDTASHESEGHCWYKRLEKTFPPEKRAGIYCMHFDGDYVEQMRALGFSVVETV